MKGTKPGTGASTQHGLNKQNERGKGATNVPLKKSMVNPTPPNIKDASGGVKGVPMPPKIDAESGGKRVVMSGASANKHTSTFRAPRSGGGGGSATDTGYTKLGKV